MLPHTTAGVKEATNSLVPQTTGAYNDSEPRARHPKGKPVMSAAQEYAEEASPGDEAEEPVYVSPWAYLRAMALIAWSTFRHPFSTTTIDLATGECVHEG